MSGTYGHNWFDLRGVSQLTLLNSLAMQTLAAEKRHKRQPHQKKKFLVLTTDNM